MIVVSDTSPLNYLLLIHSMDVLPQLFTEVIVPPSVVQELTRTKAPAVVRQWASSLPDWVRVQAPTQRLTSTARLHAGEADAISLAKELDIRDILIDERRGRNVATSEGLLPIPTLAVLEKAASEGLLDLPAVIQLLQQTNFRVPVDQLHAALARDAARKSAS